MIKYEIKPSVRLIYDTVISNMSVGYMPFLHHILVNDYGYTRKEIMSEIGGSKPYISNSLARAKEKLENPTKLVQYNLFLQKIEIAFKRQLLSIDKSMFNVREIK